MRDVAAAVATIVGWASQSPPMPRKEFEAKLSGLLGQFRQARKPPLSEEQRAAIRDEYDRTQPPPGKYRKGGQIQGMCDRHGISRHTLYEIVRARNAP